MSMEINKTCKTSFRTLFDFCNSLQNDLMLRKQFEEDPNSVFPNECESITLTIGEEKPTSLIELLGDSPKGIRFVTLDRLVQMMKTQNSGGDPEVTPYVLFAGANAIAIYNAIIVGNIGGYHEVIINVYFGANVAVVQESAGKGTVSTSELKNEICAIPNVELEDSYFESELHSYLREQKFGESREKMLLRKILSENSHCHSEDGCVSLKYVFHGKNIIVKYRIDNGVYHVLAGSLNTEDKVYARV